MNAGGRFDKSLPTYSMHLARRCIRTCSARTRSKRVRESRHEALRRDGELRDHVRPGGMRRLGSRGVVVGEDGGVKHDDDPETEEIARREAAGVLRQVRAAGGCDTNESRHHDTQPEACEASADVTVSPVYD